MPQRAETTRHVDHAAEDLVVVRRPSVRLLHRARQVRPLDELVSLLVREVEQRGQHPRREFDRDPINPVEGLVDRKLVQHLLNAGSDQAFHLAQVLGRDNSLHRRPLQVVSRRVHRDEHGQVHEPRRLANDDERLGGEGLMVLVDGDDVGMAGNRPERSERAVGLVVHGCLVAHPLEVGLPPALPVQKGVAQVDVGELNLVHRRDRLLDEHLLTIGPSHPSSRLVVEMCPADLHLHRNDRLDLLTNIFCNVEHQQSTFSSVTSGTRAGGR